MRLSLLLEVFGCYGNPTVGSAPSRRHEALPERVDELSVESGNGFRFVLLCKRVATSRYKEQFAVHQAVKVCRMAPSS